MKGFGKIVALGALVAASSSLAFADSITISGADTFTTNGTTSTGINFIGNTGIVASAQDGPGSTPPAGVFASFIYQIATLNSFQYASAAGTQVFSVNNGAGSNLTFTITGPLTTETVTSNSNGPVLNLAGVGTFAETGVVNMSETGTFSLTSSQSAPNSGDFSFQLIGSPAVTPEPNSLVLLGSGLVGAAGMVFKRRRNGSAIA